MLPKAFLTLCAVMALVGCTTVPHASVSDDAAAKTFATKRSVANLYVFRERSMVGAAVGWDVSLDGRAFTVLTTGTYAFHEVSPGQHILSRSEDVQPFHFEAGRNYFIRFAPSLSMTGTKLQAVPEAEGRAAVAQLPRVITIY